MTARMNDIILILTAITTALIAGLFYAYCCSVNIGLGRLADKEYIGAMQAINAAILNPLFFVSFMGTLVLLPLSAYLTYRDQFLSPQFLLLLSAGVLYLTGVFGITAFGNVPLNEALANFDLSSATDKAIAGQRIKFESPWVLLHNIRTFVSVVCLVLVIIACRFKAF